MTAPTAVLELIERFERHAEAHRAGQYNEAQLRREFLDPLLQELGWDVHNRQGFADAYKDVIHEDAIKVGGATKAPDYCFRVGGTRKFFVEAKKPSVDVVDDASAAYQLRRYAWSAKLPLSLLSNFDQTAVYDCRARPDKDDKASTGRVLLLDFRELPSRWDELAGVFSRQAVLRGDFDKFAASKKAKRGTAEVDAAFLKEIERWRDELARNLALRNEGVEERDLNFAVQRTIDRIVFLRICEDRGAEDYGRLLALVNGERVYARLGELFQRADERYNSGLFHFQEEKGRAEPPDELTLSLAIDDKLLKDLIRGLYYPESPYEFSVLPADILGQVYEQFLGKVIRLTTGNRAVVEDKPEVKKAGGVFYTPTYVVEYIVQQTVGKLLENMTPREAARLRVLDPACGSGSFLLGAYQYLLDWHLRWYGANDLMGHATGKRPSIFQGPGGDWRLTTSERKRILLNNIYGVDIDPQAVEVTKLSLLLKVLEGESQETLERQRRIFHDRVLPDLGNNVKCGNSLIGRDFYNGRQMGLFDEQERYRINVFDWRAEFPAVVKAGGFDAAIGNPPYVRMESFKDLKDYFRAKYAVHDERSDLYVYFIEREQELLRDGGLCGMIVSNKFLRAKYGEKVRALFSSKAAVEKLVDLAGLPVFKGATVRTVVMVAVKGAKSKGTFYSPPPDAKRFAELEGGTLTLQEIANESGYTVPRSKHAGRLWTFSRREHRLLLERLHKTATRLDDVMAGRICMGIKSGLAEAFVIDERRSRAILRRNSRARAILRPYLQGRNVRRYEVEPSHDYLIYTYHGVDMSQYPAVLEHLQPFRKQLGRRATKQKWYELQQPQLAYKELLERPKIVFPDIATHCRFALDTRGCFPDNTVYFLPTDDRCLLGLLNSKVALFYFMQTCAALEGAGDAYLRFFGQYLSGFPVPKSEHLDSKRRSKLTARLTELVDQMLALAAQRNKAKTDHDKTALERQLEATDRQIDQIVYALYGLTDEEIVLVEQATSSQRPPEADAE